MFTSILVTILEKNIILYGLFIYYFQFITTKYEGDSFIATPLTQNASKLLGGDIPGPGNRIPRLGNEIWVVGK
jgi:hypothetical protein